MALKHVDFVRNRVDVATEAPVPEVDLDGSHPEVWSPRRVLHADEEGTRFAALPDGDASSHVRPLTSDSPPPGLQFRNGWNHPKGRRK